MEKCHRIRSAKEWLNRLYLLTLFFKYFDWFRFFFWCFYVTDFEFYSSRSSLPDNNVFQSSSPLFISLLRIFEVTKSKYYNTSLRNQDPKMIVTTHLFLHRFWIVFLHIYIYIVKPLITNTSEELIKCRLDNFSMSFILYYVNFSICENE